MQLGSRLRRLFATILIFCSPSQPDVLWAEFWQQICDDLPLSLRRLGRPNTSEREIQDYGLYLLDQVLKESGYGLANWPSMPRPQLDWENLRVNPLIAEQLNYDPHIQHQLLQERLPQLNLEQHAAYNDIVSSVLEDKGMLFFINGPGGTGKTFLYNVICNKLRGEGLVVLCVASSGIAALLLPGGRTSHSTFKIPINLHEDSTCSFGKDSDRGDLIRKAKVVI
ncbi:PIF1-like helicase-domain-containing protein, partial [Panaeolus papilionaceus]